eukprot:SAG22_NODE_7512_length_732_cov_1.698262_2_plen_181_part_01
MFSGFACGGAPNPSPSKRATAAMIEQRRRQAGVSPHRAARKADGGGGGGTAPAPVAMGAPSQEGLAGGAGGAGSAVPSAKLPGSNSASHRRVKARSVTIAMPEADAAASGRSDGGGSAEHGSKTARAGEPPFESPFGLRQSQSLTETDVSPLRASVDLVMMKQNRDRARSTANISGMRHQV